MGQKDIAEKILEDYNDVFADIVNVLMFKGERRIAEDELTEAAPRSAYKADGKYRELERDVIKHWTNGSIRIAAVGLENQTAADKDMPMRILGYDATEYSRQLKTKTDKKNKEKKEAGRRPEDKNSRIRYPVVSLVLYFGYEERWNGPLRLHDMFDISADMEEYVNDYRINLFEIAWLDRETIDAFQSDFGIVADYFWQKRMNAKYMPSNTEIRHVQETLSMLSILSGNRRFEDILNSQSQAGKEPHNMKSFWDEARQEGRQEGIREGLFAAKADSIRSLMESLKFTADQAMDALKIPENERETLRAIL